MAEIDKIKERIAELASRPKNVTKEEIEWVVNQLKPFHKVTSRKARHGALFSVDGKKFMVNHHNPGQKQVKKYSVDDFLEVLMELGWYEED
jgi:hypothetical protein